MNPLLMPLYSSVLLLAFVANATENVMPTFMVDTSSEVTLSGKVSWHDWPLGTSAPNLRLYQENSTYIYIEGASDQIEEKLNELDRELVVVTGQVVERFAYVAGLGGWQIIDVLLVSEVSIE